MRAGWAIAGAMLLAGCNAGPDFRPVDEGTPPHWWGGLSDPVASRPTFGSLVEADWWDRFGDPELSSLVGRLARQNLGLQQSAEQVEQARAQREVTAAQGRPTLDATGSYDRTRASPKLLSSLFQLNPNATPSFDVFQDGLLSSWEVDLFGRVRRAVEARQADVEAEVEALHSVALMAISDLAQDYMQLRGAQAMEAIARANLADARTNSALVRDRFVHGVGTTLDTENAEAQEATIAAALPPLLATEAQLIDAIGLLLSEPPRALAAELSTPAPQPIVPPTVPIGLPAELARRRPDVREAEVRLHAATAETGVAVASFYPELTLTGMAGTQALQFPQSFNIASGFYMFGPSLAIPIFEGGRLRATLRLRRSQQRQAALAYKATVLQAWRDVDVALVSYGAAQQQRDRIAAAAGHDAAALAAARLRFGSGATDFLNVLSAQAALLQTQNSLAQSTVAVENDLVSLYRALGGGWQIADAATGPVPPSGPVGSGTR